MADRPRTDAPATDSEAVPAAPTRRVVLAGALAVGAMPILAACGGDESDPAATGGGDTSAGGGKSGSDGQSTAGGDRSGADRGDGEPVVVAAKADVPKGGGLIVPDEQLVITQPTAGMFNGFSSICTHQQCPVDNVSDGTINCICHGSMFSIETGDVVAGPATTPLPKKPIIVSGKDILLAEQ